MIAEGGEEVGQGLGTQLLGTAVAVLGLAAAQHHGVGTVVEAVHVVGLPFAHLDLDVGESCVVALGVEDLHGGHVYQRGVAHHLEPVVAAAAEVEAQVDASRVDDVYLVVALIPGVLAVLADEELLLYGQRAQLHGGCYVLQGDGADAGAGAEDGGGTVEHARQAVDAPQDGCEQHKGEEDVNPKTLHDLTISRFDDLTISRFDYLTGSAA